MRPFIFILLIIMLSSCEVYLFEKPQPIHTRALKLIPSELIGTYSEKEGDTLIITNDSYTYLSNDPKQEKSLKSEKVVLKKMDDYYILNQKAIDSTGNTLNSLWEVYALKVRGDQLTVYSMTYIDEDRKLFADSIRKIVSVKEQPVDKETLHVINPTKRQFKSLLENNLYRKVMTFEKLN